MPIRWRLTLWFATVLCLILVFTGIVLYFLLRSYLTAAVDDNLRVYSARVHGTLNAQRLPAFADFRTIHSRLPPINEFASPGLYLQIIDKSGNIVTKSSNLGEQELPVDPSLINKSFTGGDAIASVAAGDNALVRVIVSPLYLGDQALTLEVAQSLTPVEVTLNNVNYAIFASILLALLLATISGGEIVGRALRPVSRITRTAESIETGADLTRRVGYKGPDDEIGRLANTFDHMIEHLDSTFASMKRFVADASHDLRSPLTVIRGNIDLLERNLSEEDRRESLRAIKSESERMSKIVIDLLFLAEIDSRRVDNVSTVPLDRVVMEESARARSLNARRHILVGSCEKLEIKGDSYQLNRMLGNLLDNAIKYTPDGGTITTALFKDGQWARLEVTDTGIGIPPEHLPHIFERFYRVDKARSRTNGSIGLGLAIAKGVAEHHGGRITVASAPGKGSTFTVWLKL